MSCYVVENKTINKVLVAIEVARLGQFLGSESLEKAPKQELGEKLLALNVRSYNERYGNAQDEPVESFRFNPIEGTCKNSASYFKAIQCFLYQCAEGEVDQDPLYKEIENLASNYAYEIVRKTSDYKEAPWG